MKTPIRPLLLTALSCGTLLTAAAPSFAATLEIDPAKPWSGYMNVYGLVAGAQGGYLWGSSWGTADLRGSFSGDTLTLAPNINTYDPANSYWVNPDGSPAKWMEANFYVDMGTLSEGQALSFTGTTLSYTLSSPYKTVAVIKEFGPGYSWIGQTIQELTPGTTFTVSRTIGAGNIAQYGFITTGPNANPATANSLGSAVFATVPEPATSGLLLLGIAGLLAVRRKP